jgi:hypothetical protein
MHWWKWGELSGGLPHFFLQDGFFVVGGHGFDIVRHYCAVDNFFPSSKDP